MPRRASSFSMAAGISIREWNGTVAAALIPCVGFALARIIPFACACFGRTRPFPFASLFVKTLTSSVIIRSPG